ncbi:MAG: endoribonuclease MazF [Bryobacteraceae bacterium]
MAGYVPEAGDFVWLTFDPQAGHEQAGRRPALILSPKAYNQKAGLALACPVSTRVKGYPFEVAVPDGGRVSGVVLSDQVKSLDWKERRVEHAGKAPGAVVEEVLARLAPLLGY